MTKIIIFTCWWKGNFEYRRTWNISRLLNAVLRKLIPVGPVDQKGRWNWCDQQDNYRRFGEADINKLSQFDLSEK